MTHVMKRNQSERLRDRRGAEGLFSVEWSGKSSAEQTMGQILRAGRASDAST